MNLFIKDILGLQNSNINKSDDFDKIVEEITNRNINRSYPDINDIPNQL